MSLSNKIKPLNGALRKANRFWTGDWRHIQVCVHSLACTQMVIRHRELVRGGVILLAIHQTKFIFEVLQLIQGVSVCSSKTKCTVSLRISPAFVIVALGHPSGHMVDLLVRKKVQVLERLQVNLVKSE